VEVGGRAAEERKGRRYSGMIPETCIRLKKKSQPSNIAILLTLTVLLLFVTVWIGLATDRSHTKNTQQSYASCHIPLPSTCEVKAIWQYKNYTCNLI